MSFINSIFLFATAAAALPVLYHLVRRMKARKVPFGSLMFLRAAPKELIRRRRLRDRLLMAARAALFGLLALAFARPYLPAEEIPFLSARESESVVVLLDRSMSMRYAGAFERALEAARERIEAAAPGDELAVVSFADAADLRAPLGSDPAVRRAALSSIEPSFRTTDYYPALQRAQDVLREARHSRRVVVLISDFQDTGWSGTLENWKLDPGLVFEPVPVGSGAVNNAFVEDFRLSGRRSGGRYTLRYDARIASLGEGHSRSAALIVEGRESERRPIPSRSEAPLTFQHNAPREGPFQGSLEMEPDDLPEDDRYFFTARAETPPNILVLDTPSDVGLRDAFYLRNAFDLGEMSRFHFAAAERATPGTLDRNDVVILANRVASGAGELSSLRAFVERGGTLILSPGDAASPSGLSRLLDEFGLGGIDHVVDARDEQGYEAIIGEVDMRHPIFAPFSERNAILKPTFRRYARLIPAEGTLVVGRFDSGDPFIAERPVGRGLVVFFASTFNTSWTDLPLDEIYLPLVYQIAGYGAGRSDVRSIYRVGEPVGLTGEPLETWEVRAPGDRLYRVRLDEEGNGYFRETEEPGHYVAAGGSATRLFSVNVDARESDLRARDTDEVYASVVSSSDEALTTPAQAAAAVVESDERRQKLWRLLILAVVGLFVVETFFANRRRVKNA